MSKTNKKHQVKEAMKTSEKNWISYQTAEEKELYAQAIEEIQKRYEKFEQPSYKEVKAKINKARRQGKLYETEDRLGVFKYIATWRYTADMIANYSGRTGYVTDRNGRIDTRNIRICVDDIYLYIRETEECIHIVNHEWFNTELCKWEVIKYFCQYGELKEGIVFMPFMKALKYATAYKKNLSPEETKYQIVTASKRERCLYVQSKLKVSGRHYSYEYIRQHLNEF
jgi:hypothetical protein